MNKRAASAKYFFILTVTALFAAFLPACGKRQDSEAEQKVYGIDFVQNHAISYPEQIVCGPKCAWVITAAKGSCIYQLDYDPAVASEIPWQQGEGERLINIAQRDGILYAEVYLEEKEFFEIRKYIGGIWLKVTALAAENEEWANVGGGLFVDSDENIYLVSRGKVTLFKAEGETKKEYPLGGDACFFRENAEGEVECMAAAEKGIVLYGLGEDGAEKKWELKVSAQNPVGVVSVGGENICLSTGEELLFIESGSGSLLARSDLLVCGVRSLLGGVYDAQEESLRLYGTESDGNLCCSLLSVRETYAQQRTELVYGTMGAYKGSVRDNVKDAIMAFNRTNENYYITVRNYDSYGDNDLQRLHADMAGGNGPDIIEMYALGNYETYVKNGYLEDLTPYLERSLYQDDILWNVLNAYESDGGMYLIIPHFSVEALAINPEYQEKIEEWNMETFLELVEDNRWEQPILGGLNDAQTLLWYLLSGRQEEFIDWNRKEAAFETEEFEKLLALCKENGEQEWPNVSEWTFEEMQRNAICGLVFLPDFSGYLTLVDVYGREYPLYGYPTSDGQEYRIGLYADSCAIYAGSEHKEGAWEYIESLLDEERQIGGRIGDGIPIRRSVMEKYGKEQKKLEWGSQNNIKTLTDAELDIIKAVLYQGNLTRGQLNEDILNVVREEAAAYFAGDKSAGETARIIQSRVEIILSE